MDPLVSDLEGDNLDVSCQKYVWEKNLNGFDVRPLFSKGGQFGLLQVHFIYRYSRTFFLAIPHCQTDNICRRIMPVELTVNNVDTVLGVYPERYYQVMPEVFEQMLKPDIDAMVLYTYAVTIIYCMLSIFLNQDISRKQYETPSNATNALKVIWALIPSGKRASKAES